jgi:hypothetical protein
VIRSFGNVLRHAYDQIDAQRVWEIVAHDLSQVKASVAAGLTRIEMPPSGSIQPLRILMRLRTVRHNPAAPPSPVRRNRVA